LEKVVRAVERTDATVKRKGWRFFDQDEGPPPKKRALPKNAVGSNCSLGSGAVTKATDLDFDLLHLALELGNLPPELLIWMLDEICLERSDRLRNDYTQLIMKVPSLDDLVTPTSVKRLFYLLGASKDLENLETQLQTVHYFGEQYPKRDWRRVRSLLALLTGIAHRLHPSTIAYCVTMLLRLGVDREAVHEALLEYQHAIGELIAAVPADVWDEFVSLLLPT
jgi:hypothetical protein